VVGMDGEQPHSPTCLTSWRMLRLPKRSN